jgi:hypothetical protein
MMEVIFIAKIELQERQDYFPRVRAKAQIKGELLTKIPFLHFESVVDMKFVRKHMKNHEGSGFLETENFQMTEFVFTHKKNDTITEHRKALKSGLTVSTLVDMDWDASNSHWAFELKHIHSTRYACTLFTMQFLKESKILDLEILIRVVKDISNIKDMNKIQKIIDNAIENTSKRLQRAHVRAMEIMDQEGISSPLNDHELAMAITRGMGFQDDSKDFKSKSKRVEKKLQDKALEDSNGYLIILLKKMLDDVSLS